MSLSGKRQEISCNSTTSNLEKAALGCQNIEILRFAGFIMDVRAFKTKTKVNFTVFNSENSTTGNNLNNCE